MSLMSAEQDFIPHIVEPHPLTGLTNGKLGIWLFLCSEVMLFGALFSSYFLLRAGGSRSGHPRAGSRAICSMFRWRRVNTAVLITSSITMVLAWASFRKNREPA